MSLLEDWPGRTLRRYVFDRYGVNRLRGVFDLGGRCRGAHLIRRGPPTSAMARRRASVTSVSYDTGGTYRGRAPGRSGAGARAAPTPAARPRTRRGIERRTRGAIASAGPRAPLS